MVKHVCFYLALIILLISFGCGKKEESKPANNVSPPVKAQSWTLGEGFESVESEGRDEATGLWKEIVHKKSGIRLRLIPAGEFDMGSPDNEEGRFANEGPVHHVKISKPFYIGKYEVTQAQWKTVMGADNNPSNFKGDDLPVETVSWNDAQDFLKKAGDGLRLPTEAEWEYACRAGSKTRWYFGDNEGDLKDNAWYSDNSGNKTHAVGQKGHNEWGLYDMHGNVWEWCEDVWHGNYNDAPNDGSAWTTGGDEKSPRVLRGGSWRSLARVTRSANRLRSEPDGWFSNIGFRLAVAARANP